jgi:hypothetical protein
MKWTADHKACRRCRVHRALFVTRRGRVKWDPDHDLCSRCFQSVRDSVRSIGMTGAPAPAPIRVAA